MKRTPWYKKIPWWGWVLIALVIVIGGYIKLNWFGFL